MRNRVGAAAGIVLFLCAAFALEYGRAQEKAPARGSLRVKVHYKGSGAVDEKHKILVFLFDSPEFAHGGVMPFAVMSTNSRDGTVTFEDVAKSPVYVGSVYDPSGNYAEQQGPPPAGASLGMYSKTPGEPAPVNIGAGKTVSVEVPFDDTVKMK